MTKTQKMYLRIFLAMFVLPEVLWSPVTNILYEFSKNSGQPYIANFLMNPDNITWLNFVLLIQVIGLLLSSILLWKNTRKNYLYVFFAIFLSVLTVIVSYLFYISMTLGRNGIG